MAGEMRLQRFRTWVMTLGSLALLPMYTLVSNATSLLRLLQGTSNTSDQKCAKMKVILQLLESWMFCKQ